MPIRRNAANDPSAGCYTYPKDNFLVEQPDMMKKISDIIETTKRAEERDNKSFDRYPWLPKSEAHKTYRTFEEAYAEGYIDGKNDGFREGLHWMGK